MSQAYLIIYNGRPGSRAGTVAKELSAALTEHRLDAELWPTKPGSAGLAEIEPSDYRGILVVGGDGTLHNVLNGLQSFPVPIGFLGTGTVNVLSRELGLPRSARTFADMVVAGRTIEVPQLKANDRRCLVFPEAGFLGRVVCLVNDWREKTAKHGRFEYVRCALSTIPRSWGRQLRVTLQLLDGTTVDRWYSNILITRARLYAGILPMPVAKNIERPLEERSFESIGYRTATPVGHVAVLILGFLRLLPPLKGFLRATGLLECNRATRAWIKGPGETMSHIDAETFGEMPIHVSFDDGAFSLFVRPG